MTTEEREALISESNGLRIKMKEAQFISPIDMRRVNEITSLLISSGETTEIRLVAGKLRKSRRVTSFTRDRR